MPRAPRPCPFCCCKSAHLEVSRDGILLPLQTLVALLALVSVGGDLGLPVSGRVVQPLQAPHLGLDRLGAGGRWEEDGVCVCAKGEKMRRRGEGKKSGQGAGLEGGAGEAPWPRCRYKKITSVAAAAPGRQRKAGAGFGVVVVCCDGGASEGFRKGGKAVWSRGWVCPPTSAGP